MHIMKRRSKMVAGCQFILNIIHDEMRYTQNYALKLQLYINAGLKIGEKCYKVSSIIIVFLYSHIMIY